jgi:hypothetical protein
MHSTVGESKISQIMKILVVSLLLFLQVKID